MNTTISKVKETVNRFNMILPGDKILVGFSGGADSLFLFLSLLELKKECDFTLFAAHLNHGIRGSEADRDENFVKKICSHYNVSCITKKVDIPKISAEQKISEECAGRNERYRFFDELCQKYNINKIAVAHNMNDSVETVLLNLIRGSSLNGLCGIKPVNGNIIRPIIEIKRDEIELFLKDINHPYCIDSTNSLELYTRNKIRNNILKSISEINPSIIETVYSNLKYLRDDRDFLDQYSKNLNCITNDNKEIIIDKYIFENQHIAIKSRIIMEAFYKIKGSCNNISGKHVEIICNAQKAGNVYNMPDNVKVTITHKSIIFSRNENIDNSFYFPICPGEAHVFFDYIITCSYVTQCDFNNKNAIYIDADKITDEKFIIRNRQNGDKFIPYGMKSTKKLKQYFNDIKIPPHERDKIPIITSSNEIVAVLPYRICDKFKITDKTVKIIEIKLTKEAINVGK